LVSAHTMSSSSWRSRFVRVVLLCSTAAASTGCYTQRSVRPSEVPKLDGRYRDPAAGPTAPPVGNSTRLIEGVDGRMVEVDGDQDLTVTLTDGKVLVFLPPLQVQDAAGVLVIRSTNRRETRLALADIQKVTVSQRDVGATVTASVGGAMVGVVLLICVAIGLAS
jgi:hypothetical protein